MYAAILFGMVYREKENSRKLDSHEFLIGKNGVDFTTYSFSKNSTGVLVFESSTGQIIPLFFFFKGGYLFSSSLQYKNNLQDCI